jgi:type VI secretion system protein ImpA
VELATFLAPVSPDNPSGAALRDNPRFDEIIALLAPASRAERLASGGDRVDWSEVLDHAAALAHSGRDLRLLVVVVRAGLNLEGLPGLAPGFQLLTDTLDGFWEDLHPHLRERSDPREAAIGRTNAIKQLENDENGLLGDLKLNTMISPRGLGPVTGQDLAEAAITEFEALNEAPSGLGQKEKAKIAAQHEELVNRVTAATRALVVEEPERAAEISSALAAALESLHTLSAKLSEKVGVGNGASIGFPELEQLLSRMRTTVVRAEEEAAGMEAEQSLEMAASAGVSASAAPGGTAAAAPGSAAPPATSRGAVNSRADVERCLDQIIEFYERTEPSSPIPHLARRMRRMVPMDFLELMAEVAPSGMKEFKSVAGVGDEKPKQDK